MAWCLLCRSFPELPFGSRVVIFSDLLPGKSSEQECTQHNEQNIWKPDQQLGMHTRIPSQGVADDDEKKIRDGDDQSHGETNRRLSAMCRDA